jgi:hypothetical protein
MANTLEPPTTRELASEVAALTTIGLPELRQVWRTRFGEPPKLRSVELLRYLLAWRIQAAALGGLDRQTRQALKRTARSGVQGRLQVGVRLAREHGGVEHQVPRGVSARNAVVSGALLPLFATTHENEGENRRLQARRQSPLALQRRETAARTGCNQARIRAVACGFLVRFTPLTHRRKA